MSEAVELVETILGLTGPTDAAARGRLIHPDCEIVMPGAGRLTCEELTAYIQVFSTAFPRDQLEMLRQLGLIPEPEAV